MLNEMVVKIYAKRAALADNVQYIFPVPLSKLYILDQVQPYLSFV